MPLRMRVTIITIVKMKITVRVSDIGCSLSEAIWIVLIVVVSCIGMRLIVRKGKMPANEN
jgi:hypothetical protein